MRDVIAFIEHKGGNARRVSFELAAYLSAMVTNHLHTGRFKRSV